MNILFDLKNVLSAFEKLSKPFQEQFFSSSPASMILPQTPSLSSPSLTSKKISISESQIPSSLINPILKVNHNQEITARKYSGGREERGFFSNERLHGYGEIYKNGYLIEKGIYSDGILLEGEKYFICGKLAEKGTYGAENVMKNGEKYNYLNGRTYTWKYIGNCYNGDGSIYFDGSLREKGSYSKGHMKNGLKNVYHLNTIEIWRFEGDCVDGNGSVYVNEVLREKGQYLDGVLKKGKKLFMKDHHLHKLKGEFTKSYINGKGKTFIDGVLTEKGRYQLGFFRKGTKYYPCGAIHKGKFEQGYLQGKGTISRLKMINGVLKEVIEQDGVFLNGRLQKGKKVKDGNIYNGTFVHGLLEGEGSIIMADGTLHHGIFSKGVIK